MILRLQGALESRDCKDKSTVLQSAFKYYLHGILETLNALPSSPDHRDTFSDHSHTLMLEVRVWGKPIKFLSENWEGQYQHHTATELLVPFQYVVADLSTALHPTRELFQ